MKKVLYKCIDRECEHEFVGSNKKDGTPCPKCKGPIVPLREATAEETRRKAIPIMPRKIPMPEVKPHKNSLSISIELNGYKRFKGQLNNIERQLNRILKKQKQIESAYNACNAEEFVWNSKDGICAKEEL